MGQDIPLELITLIKRHEGIRLFPYLDTVGKLTIGIGRNLTDVGISNVEATQMLMSDIMRATVFLSRFTWFSGLSDTRKYALIDMVFNIGAYGFLGFKDLIRCLEKSDYRGAADAMLDSLWAKQVESRAIELATMMRG